MNLDDINRSYVLNEDIRLITPGIMVVGAANNDRLTNINVNQRYTGSIREVSHSICF